MATTEKELKGVEFDPGFGPYIMAFQGSIEYIYSDINRFKNLSQKKMRFQQFYKKILDIFYNNIGFYAGCLIWASYIKEQPKQKILNNGFLGKEYIESDNISETDYLIMFTELFPKDMKYFLGQDFSFDKNVVKLLETYKDFLVINKGFTESEYNTDIKLPEALKQDAFKLKEKADEAISLGDLSILKETISQIL